MKWCPQVENFDSLLRMSVLEPDHKQFKVSVHGRTPMLVHISNGRSLYYGCLGTYLR
ncbi:hypothetical protein DAI22_09g050500 [Oryza sativa Japonica Group]|nr:hypothetical protein DAI22_09g050500 [Oryza sativa Japonica Group]